MAVHNDCLRDVPDIFENEIGESLVTRTEGLGMIRELGPPDLCHIVKAHSSNKNEPDIGSYHHVLGVDTSSSASLAAYINSLQYSLNDVPGWFGASNSWKIVSGTYCSYNAFSNVDLRVQIKIPGGVDAYIVTVMGERKEVTEELWRECQISSLLRAILHADPLSYVVTGLRRVTPVPGPREEERIVDTIIQQFWHGRALGSNAETQMITAARNFLVDGLFRYFSGAGRFSDYAQEILSPLAYAPLGGQQRASSVRSSMDFRGIDPEVASLLAEAYLENDEEVKAVRVMHQALKVKPSCYPLLNIQAEFLRRKNHLDAALTIARMAVKYAPSEFHAWTKLAQVYVESKDYQRALLTLNACPMYTFVGPDMPRVPTPRRINYPVKADILADYDLGESFNNAAHGPVPSNARASTDSDAPAMMEEIAQNQRSDILRLSAPTLNGTFAQAYKFLAEIFSIIGWDELLLLRSQVFVMEEEYRNSAAPGIAVDDEEEEDEEDHMPLSALRERAVSQSTPSVVDQNKEADNVPNGNVAEDKQKAEDEQKVEVEAEAETETEAKAEAQTESKPEADVETANDAESEAVVEPEPKETTAAQPASGKKKNKKKNKGKKSQDNLKPDAQQQQQQQQEEEVEAVQADEAAVTGSQNNDEKTNGHVEQPTLAALGNAMEDVSLSDNEAADANEKPIEAAETKEDGDTVPSTENNVQAENDAKVEAAAPETHVAAPQVAVFEPKEASEPKETAPSTSDIDIDGDGDSHVQLSGNGCDKRLIRKRLCERWLDNLIMMLFEDLRAYTSWRSRMHNLRATGQQVTYTFTQAEWEALGDLALRLHRPSEAREAYEYALAIRFSARAWQRLLEMYVGKYQDMQKKERLRHEDAVPFPPLNSNESLTMALDAIVWLTVYSDRWYNSMSYPNPICANLIKLVKIHGMSKVRNSLVSMHLKPSVSSLINGYFEIAEKFDVDGSKW
ncbi:bud site selection protein [Coemansia sp. Benny D115]|nr:bud site selection protein [Coemansia sp. Benny D115]